MRINLRTDLFKALSDRRPTDRMLVIFKRDSASSLAPFMGLYTNGSITIEWPVFQKLDGILRSQDWGEWINQAVVFKPTTAFDPDVLADVFWENIDTVEIVRIGGTPVQQLLMGQDFITGKIQLSGDDDVPKVLTILDEPVAPPDYLPDRARIIYERMKDGPLSRRN